MYKKTDPVKIGGVTVKFRDWGIPNKLTVSESIKKVANLFDKTNVNFEVSPLKPDYYKTDLDIEYFPAVGPWGCAGPYTYDVLDGRKHFGDDQLVINIHADVETGGKEHELERLVDRLWTKGPNNKCTEPEVSKLIPNKAVEHNTIKYGVYKKPNFDQVLKLLPHLSSEELIKKPEGDYDCPERETFNTHFVNIKPYYSDDNNIDEGCLTTFNERETKESVIDYKLDINIVASDVERNYDTLKKISELIKMKELVASI